MTIHCLFVVLRYRVPIACVLLPSDEPTGRLYSILVILQVMYLHTGRLYLVEQMMTTKAIVVSQSANESKSFWPSKKTKMMICREAKWQN